MDNTQKAALIAVIGVIAGFLGYVVYTVNSEAAAEQEHNDMCNNWSDQLEFKRAELEGRQHSLGGQLDLDGAVETMRLQFNLEVEQWNTECS